MKIRMSMEDIKRQTQSKTKLEKARHVKEQQLIKRITITQMGKEYQIEARMETLENEFYATMQFTWNDYQDVEGYFCSCKRTKICEHILAVLLQIYELAPEEFPYTYERPNDSVFLQEMKRKQEEEAIFQQVRHGRKKEKEITPELIGKTKGKGKEPVFAGQPQEAAEKTLGLTAPLETELAQGQESVILKPITTEAANSRQIKEASYREVLQQAQAYYRELCSLEHVEQVHLRVEVMADKEGFFLSLKVGETKWYAIHSIKTFFQHIANKDVVRYGTSLAFSHDWMKFDDNSRKMLQFLRNVYYEAGIRETREGIMELPHSYVDDFYEILLSYPKDYCNVHTLDQLRRLQLQIEQQGDDVRITLKNASAFTSCITGAHHGYYLQEPVLYRYPFDTCGRCIQLLEILREPIQMKEAEFLSFYKYVLSEQRAYIQFHGLSQSYQLEPKAYCLRGVRLDGQLLAFYLDVHYDGMDIAGFRKDGVRPLKQEIIEEMVHAYADVWDVEKQAMLFYEGREAWTAFQEKALPFLKAYCEIKLP